MIKRIFGVLLLAFALMHLIGSALLFIRFGTARPLSLVLGPVFLVGAIALLRSRQPIGK